MNLPAFRHIAFYGMTGQGKSTLMKNMARIYSGLGFPQILFNPTGDEGWPADVVEVFNADQLERALWDERLYGAMVHIDEAKLLRVSYKPQTHLAIATLGSVGRKSGHTVHAAAQYPTSLDPNLRWNCNECYCFALQNAAHAKEVAADFGNPSIEGVPVNDIIMRLQPLEAVHLTRQSAEIISIRHLIPGAAKGAPKGVTPGAYRKGRAGAA